MPKMRNISQRQFVIAGKTLKQGETGEFAQSVIDRHVSMYPQELEAVAGEIEQKSPIKDSVPTLTEEIKEVTTEKYPADVNHVFTSTKPIESVTEKAAEDAPTPKKRGRKPKAKE